MTKPHIVRLVGETPAAMVGLRSVPSEPVERTPEPAPDPVVIARQKSERARRRIERDRAALGWAHDRFHATNGARADCGFTHPKGDAA